MVNRFLIVGLGNPGKQYDNTRHNVGFFFLNFLHEKFDFSNQRSKYEALLFDANYENSIITSAKPMTYMNNSGCPVRKIVDFYKIDVQNVIVIHDDIDLEFGKIKVKRSGGHGGHNGLRSLDESIGKNYLRIRIGVGRPDDKHQVSNYVLSDFTKDQKKEIESICKNIAGNFHLILKNKVEEFLQNINKG